MLYTGSRAEVLKCIVTYNRFGGYCVPQSSCHRPAARKILFGEVWEPETIEYMASHVGSGDIVHAGTYFGDFLPALSQACAVGANVWAFEPNPENFRCARVTIEINGLNNVEIMNAGLGAQSGKLPMKVSDESGRALGGGSRLGTGNGETRNEQFIEADIIMLDDVLPVDRRITVLQLDVEGFEQQALSGAIGTIRRCKPILVLESLPDGRWFKENILSLGYRESGKLHDNTILTVGG